MKKKILLTGSGGFIGRNIKESYLSDRYDIVAPRSRELDLSDTAAVNGFFRNNYFDAVIHAAIKPGHRNAGDLSDFLRTNLKMFDNLAANSEKYRKFINIGSGAVYDVGKDNRMVRETDIKEPESDDLTTGFKYTVHRKIEKLDNFVDLNLFGVFGKYEDWEIRFISNAICKALFGLPITLRQDRIFSYLYIDDLMPVLEYFIDNTARYKNYNVVPDEEITLLTAAKTVSYIAGVYTEIEVAKEGLGLSYSGDNGRLRREIPGLKFTDFETAVSRLYDYYRVNKDMIKEEKLLSDK